MNRDRHHARLLDALLVEPIEMVDATQEDFVRTMPLNGGDDNVIDLVGIATMGRGDAWIMTGWSSTQRSQTYSMPASAR